MKREIGWLATTLLVAGLIVGSSRADEPLEQEDRTAGTLDVAPISAPYAQWLVEATMSTHAALRGMEIVARVDGVLRTIAASDAGEIGERSGADDDEIIRTGMAAVESPESPDEPYEVTSPLLDAGGNAIGVLSLDIAADDLDENQVVTLARNVRAEMEERIASEEALFEAIP
ncbi:MAG: hypothetical protein R3B81_12855 [bacterium]